MDERQIRQAKKWIVLIAIWSVLLITIAGVWGTKQLISFAEELKNIKSYVNIEKMRVGKGLVVEYQIEDEDFFLPGLSIEAFVENRSVI